MATVRVASVRAQVTTPSSVRIYRVQAATSGLSPKVRIARVQAATSGQIARVFLYRWDGTTLLPVRNFQWDGTSLIPLTSLP